MTKSHKDDPGYKGFRDGVHEVLLFIKEHKNDLTIDDVIKNLEKTLHLLDNEK